MDRAVTLTKDPRFAAFAHSEWKATQDYLYDREEHLFYRDSRFFERRDSKGRKVFWSRGNGWVFAGVARVLTLLPKDDKARAGYEALCKEMAAQLQSLQKQDGYCAELTARTGKHCARIERHRLFRLWSGVGHQRRIARSGGLRSHHDFEPGAGCTS